MNRGIRTMTFRSFLSFLRVFYERFRYLASWRNLALGVLAHVYSEVSKKEKFVSVWNLKGRCCWNRLMWFKVCNSCVFFRFEGLVFFVLVVGFIVVSNVYRNCLSPGIPRIVISGAFSCFEVFVVSKIYRSFEDLLRVSLFWGYISCHNYHRLLRLLREIVRRFLVVFRLALRGVLAPEGIKLVSTSQLR